MSDHTRRLDELPLVGALLGRLGITTEAELATLEPEDLRSLRGVGERKLAVLADLVAAARAGTDLPLPSPRRDAEPREVSAPLAAPPAVGPLLRRLGVRSVDDVLGLDLAALRQMPGVGAGKVRALADWVARERAERGLEDPVVAAALRHADAPVPESLGRLDPRSAAAVRRSGARTLAELDVWLRTADFAGMKNIGNSTIGVLRDRIDAVEALGPDEVAFGGPAPRSVSALAERFLARIPERVREVCIRRLRDGLTLGAIGDDLGVTRERIRQIVDAQIEADRPVYGPLAARLIAPAIAHLTERGGIAATAGTLGAVGNPPAWAVAVAARLANESLILDAAPGVATLLDIETFAEVRRELREQVDALLRHTCSVADVRALWRDAGLGGSDGEIDELVRRWLEVRIDGGFASASQRPAQSLYRRVLLEAGEPLSAAEIAARAERLEPGRPHLPRNVVSAFQRMRDVLSQGGGLWVHESCLAVDRDTLDALAVECLPEVIEAEGAPVSARLLLAGLRERGVDVDGITPHMLRDALLDTGEVRSWRSGVEVAWLGGDTHRQRLVERIAEIATSFRGEFGLNDLAGEVERRTGFTRASILQQVPFVASLMRCGHGRFCRRDEVFPRPGDLERAQSALLAALPRHGVTSAPSVLQRLPELRGGLARIGPGPVWGLGHAHPDIVARSRGLLLWRRELGTTVWHALAAWLGTSLAFTTDELGAELTSSAGPLQDVVLHQVLAEGVRDGWLLRVGRGFYVAAKVDREAQLDALAAHPAIGRVLAGKIEAGELEPRAMALRRAAGRRIASGPRRRG